MAVFTPVTLDDLAPWMTQFPLGKALAIKGIASGIENSNFFITTEAGEFVLTIFENLSFEQLPFYLKLMRRLADHGVLVPAPIANAQGELVVALHGKPASIVTKLEGASQMSPAPVHCAEVGAMLARMHLAAKDFEIRQKYCRSCRSLTSICCVPKFIIRTLLPALRCIRHCQTARCMPTCFAIT
jgi:homoserine kinase type II